MKVMSKVLYGALFVVVVPGLLMLWAAAARPNVAIPVYGSTAFGGMLAVSGLGLMLTAMLELWRLGGGLPMNAFPPPKLVATGTFNYLPHPIYTGFVMACLGVSMVAQSSSGLWLITPTIVAACTALVLGYERGDLKRRFGNTLHLLPADEDTAPSTLERLRFFFVVLIPWLALYGFTAALPLHGTAFGLSFEENLPIFRWTILIYESSYVTVVLAPWCARTRRDLRKLMVSAWVSMAIVFPIYWFIPSSAPRRPLTHGGWMADLLHWERVTYPPTAALPSFHVLWAIFVARLYRPRWLGVAYVVAISLSCITTGMHYIADVVAAFAVAPLFLEPRRRWDELRRLTEWLANSWREWRLGPVRIINYAVYAGIAGFVQTVALTAILGPGREWKALLIATAGLGAAAAWAQWIEGSSRFRRPFGFYGGLIGAGVACLFFPERWALLGSCCLAAPWMQAIGRLRCLVNGCCHGSPASAEIGIRVTNPRSRVTRLSDLARVPIHPTQLYSILSNVLLGFVIARLWFSGCPLSLICGIYGIGSGISRFIEEAYRGEPQTPAFLGLRLYQWMAAGTLIVGAVLTTLHSPVPPTLMVSLQGVVWATLFAFLAAAAMGIDFPESDRLLARLT
jgi:prolipoprotein diacylglyceryltransferase/protein-S-isoprenylcysteine O-methyltransferase Ste14